MIWTSTGNKKLDSFLGVVRLGWFTCLRIDVDLFDARRHVPIDLDVGQHEFLGEGATFESQTKPLADHAVRAVAADQVPGDQRALASGVTNRLNEDLQRDARLRS